MYIFHNFAPRNLKSKVMRFFSEEFGMLFEFNSFKEFIRFKFMQLRVIIGGFVGKLIFYGLIFYLLYKLGKG